MKKISVWICLALMVWTAAACQNVSENTIQTPEATQNVNTTSLSRETTLGPVHAVVSMTPEKPTLGDQVTLTIDVDADPAIEVEMPEFGDQLGRFNIAEFRPSKQLLDNGKMRYVQVYRLDLPMSGKLRIPSFLVEFTDNRESAQPDVRGKVQELLTEEVSFDVASLLPEGEVMKDLNPTRPHLEELVLPQDSPSYAWIMALLAIVVAAGTAAFWISRRKKPEIILPPHVVAIRDLEILEKKGIPSEPDDVDNWYVELSGILRKYVEGRFELHAPCLTTQEFLECAGASNVLKNDEKNRIREILEKSDRVKFTDFIPPQSDSIAILGETRRFIESTRPDTSENEPKKEESANAHA